MFKYPSLEAGKDKWGLLFPVMMSRSNISSLNGIEYCTDFNDVFRVLHVMLDQFLVR